MDSIVLIGGGGHCKSVIDVIEQENRFSIEGIVDQPALLGNMVLGYEVIGCDADLPQLVKKIKYAVVSVGQIKSPDLRIQLFELAKKYKFLMPTIVSPRSYVSKHASLGEGTVILHDALVNADVEIGNNCIINSKALIEHDCSIGDNCHISTGAIVNGGVKIENNCFIGSNAVTREYMTIKENSFIKAGSVVA